MTNNHLTDLFRILLAALILALSACSIPAAETATPTSVVSPASFTETAAPTATSSATATVSATPVPPTETAAPSRTPTPTETPPPTGTATATLPPPTPSADEAVFIYYVQLDTGGPVACGDSLVPINTGLFKTGDVEVDVAAALGRLFSKVKGSGELVNPAYLSNIEVVSVEHKTYSGSVDVRLKGTYVRSGDRCDDRRVREQVWTTIRQFDGVKTVYILLNDNLLGDILAGG